MIHQYRFFRKIVRSGQGYSIKFLYGRTELLWTKKSILDEVFFYLKTFQGLTRR